jgi:hypothetical protein
MPKPLRKEETMMYKTIALEMIQERPALYEELRSSKRLLPTMDAHAVELKALHDKWKERLDQAKPGRDPSQVASEAMELAVEEFQRRLPSGSAGDEAEPPSLDAMMTCIQRHTPHA